MRWLAAVGITALLVAAAYAVAAAAADPRAGGGVGLLLVFGTALWAAIDSADLELKKYEGGIDHPALVFFAVAVLWVVFFPLYLVTRSRRRNGELKLKNQYRDGPAP